MCFFYYSLLNNKNITDKKIGRFRQLLTYLPGQFNSFCMILPSYFLLLGLFRHVERVFIADVVANLYRRSRMKKSEVVTSEASKETSGFGRRNRENDEDDQDIDAKVGS